MTINHPKLSRGQIVAVEFSDHAEGPNVLHFTVYGRLSSITRKCLVVDSYAYTKLGQSHDANEVRFTIVRSAIHKVVRLYPERRLVQLHPKTGD